MINEKNMISDEELDGVSGGRFGADTCDDFQLKSGLPAYFAHQCQNCEKFTVTQTRRTDVIMGRCKLHDDLRSL